jgi:hypothetical protein
MKIGSCGCSRRQTELALCRSYPRVSSILRKALGETQNLCGVKFSRVHQRSANPFRHGRGTRLRSGAHARSSSACGGIGSSRTSLSHRYGACRNRRQELCIGQTFTHADFRISDAVLFHPGRLFRFNSRAIRRAFRIHFYLIIKVGTKIGGVYPIRSSSARLTRRRCTPPS